MVLAGVLEWSSKEGHKSEQVRLVWMPLRLVGGKISQVLIRRIDSALVQMSPLLKELAGKRELRPQQGLILDAESCCFCFFW